MGSLQQKLLKLFKEDFITTNRVWLYGIWLIGFVLLGQSIYYALCIDRIVHYLT